jgi:hypothetical protein
MKDKINAEMRKALCEQLEKSNNPKAPELIKFIQERASYDQIKKMFFESKERSAAYERYFKSILKKYAVDSPDDLDEKVKKDFFNEVDAGWKAKKETD